MPVVFIHGVNTREDADYPRNEAARNALIRELVLKPLAEEGILSADMEIASPYWGDKGVTFAWHNASLPDVRITEDLGPGEEATPQADSEMAAVVSSAAGRPGAGARIESLGAEDGALKQAAVRDLPRFVEAVLSPLILSEMALAADAGESAETQGIAEALLLIAGREVSDDPAVRAEVAETGSDDEVMELLRERVEGRFQKLATERGLGGSVNDAVEELGPGFLSGLGDKIRELFVRARNAPARAAGIAALDRFRDPLHRNLTLFLGDIFVYLLHRGTKEAPGPIISAVLEPIRFLVEKHPNEPLIVFTHSMGGNVLYDILATFAPDLKVDVWVSAASQVGPFEEMKIFAGSDAALLPPKRITGLKPRVGYWLNVYDPADILAFLARPVFADADADEKFITGESALKAHGEYFKRPRFYDLVRDRVGKHYTDVAGL